MTEQKRKPDYEMEEYFEADTPEHHRAFADATRQKIMSLLSERAATTKQLADTLGFKSGSIAHHLKVLEGVGLVRVVRTRQVRAITEKYYGNVYRSVSFTAKNFSWGEELPDIDRKFMFRRVMDEYEPPPDEEMKEHPVVPSFSTSHARIPESVAEEFSWRLREIVREFETEPVPGEKVYALFAAVFPTNLPELPEETEEEE